MQSLSDTHIHTHRKKEREKERDGDKKREKEGWRESDEREGGMEVRRE